MGTPCWALVLGIYGDPPVMGFWGSPQFCFTSPPLIIWTHHLLICFLPTTLPPPSPPIYYDPPIYLALMRRKLYFTHFLQNMNSSFVNIYVGNILSRMRWPRGRYNERWFQCTFIHNNALPKLEISIRRRFLTPPIFNTHHFFRNFGGQFCSFCKLFNSQVFPIDAYPPSTSISRTYLDTTAPTRHTNFHHRSRQNQFCRRNEKPFGCWANRERWGHLCSRSWRRSQGEWGLIWQLMTYFIICWKQKL